MKSFLLWAFTALFIGTAFAQESPNWKVEFDKPIKWIRQSPTGVIIVHTDDMLHGIDPEEEKEVWRIGGLGNIKLEENADPYVEIPNTPYIKFNGLKSNKKISFVEKKLSSGSGRNFLIDAYQGKIIYDSDEHPVRLIKQEFLLEEINALLLLGKQAIMGKKAKEKYISLVSLTTGEILWTIPTLEGFNILTSINCTLDPSGNLLLSSGVAAYRINAQDGTVLWKQPYEIRKIFFDPNDPTKFFARAGYYSYINAFDLETGNPLWFNVRLEFSEKDKVVEAAQHEKMRESLKDHINEIGRGNYVVADKEKFMITGKSSFNFFDYESASPQWEKPVSFGMKIHEILPQEEGFLVKMVSNERWHISRCSNEGEILWERPIPVYGSQLFFYVMTSQGIVYMTNRMLGLLDSQTGRHISAVAFNFGEQFTPYIDWDNHKAFVFQEDKIYEIDFEAQTKKELLTKIKFKGDGKAFPHTLERIGDHYFLANDQNILLFDETGQIVHQAYYRYPGVPMWLKRAAATTARLAIAAALIYAESAGSEATLNAYFQGEIDGQTTGELLNQLDLDNSEGMLITGGGIAWEASRLISQRKSSSYRGEDYQLILTKLENGDVGLLKIDKASGKEISSITLKDKKPEYFVDDYLGILFYQPNDKKSIHAYKLQEYRK